MFSAFVVGRILHCTALELNATYKRPSTDDPAIAIQFGQKYPYFTLHTVRFEICYNAIPQCICLRRRPIYLLWELVMDFKSLRCILGLTVDTYHLLANFIFLWRIAIESSRQANGPIHPQVEDDIRTSVRILKLFWSVKLVRVVATKTRLWLNCAIVLGFQLLFSQSIRPEEGGGSCQRYN